MFEERASAQLKSAAVWIKLSGNIKPVEVGRLASSALEGCAKFAYNPDFLSPRDAVDIGPVELRLASGLFETNRRNGIFRDACPDHWGRSVLQAEMGEHAADENDFLTAAPADRVGALVFGDAAHPGRPYAR